jgi:hypothetical protein
MKFSVAVLSALVVASGAMETRRARRLGRKLGRQLQDEEDCEVIDLNFNQFETGTTFGPGFDYESINDYVKIYAKKNTGKQFVDAPAMIFDGNNPTGEDNDLKFNGKMIIISEDSDASDPDDNQNGGTMFFEFSVPLYVLKIDLLDIDESGSAVKKLDGTVMGEIPAVADGEETFYEPADPVQSTGIKIYFKGSGGVTGFLASTCKGITFGDPHFRRWDGAWYDYHGEGDFVFFRSDDFNNGAGLEVQIRTTITDSWSAIEAAAVRLGEQVVEFGLDYLLVDGSEITDEDLPVRVGGYELEPPHEMQNNKEGKIYNLRLDGESYIRIRVYQGKVPLISVAVVPFMAQFNDFKNGVGMLGSYSTGEMLSRDGSAIIEDPNEFGEEWQVRDSERCLFKEARQPQYPMPPKLPSESAMALRRTLSSDRDAKVAAANACADVPPAMFDMCVFDVVLTGDAGVAGAY